jgi:hypothetical protein
MNWKYCPGSALQAAAALEDHILQQEVFAAVEGILPEITALQERRSAATFGGLPVLTATTVEADTRGAAARPRFQQYGARSVDPLLGRA